MTEQDRELHFLNLVSRGVPLRQARIKAYGPEAALVTPAEQAAQAELCVAPDEQATPAAPDDQITPDDERSELLKALKAVGVKAHHKSSIETLRQKLADATDNLI